MKKYFINILVVFGFFLGLYTNAHEKNDNISNDLKSNCLLEGQAMEGDTWFDTH